LEPKDRDGLWAVVAIAVVIMMVTALFWLLAASSVV
jgi:hypothetical protein